MSPSVTVAGDVHGRGDELARGPAGGHRNHHGFELHLGGAFGEIDGLADGLLGVGEIDHVAGLHAARAGMAEADNNLELSGCDGAKLPAEMRLQPPTKHAILLVPTSSTATSAERFGDSGFIFGVRPGSRANSRFASLRLGFP